MVTEYLRRLKTKLRFSHQDSKNDEPFFDANDVTWATSTISAKFAVLYKFSSPQWLIAAYDFGVEKSSSVGDFTIQWNVSGIMDLT